MINFLSVYSKVENNNLQDLKDKLFNQSKKHLLFKTTEAHLYEDLIHKKFSFFFSNCDIKKHVAFLKNKQNLLFFTGCLLKDNKFAEDIESAYKDGIQSTNLLEEIGNFCMGKFGNDDDFFYQGVLSQWNVFYGENSELFVVSDNPYLVSLAINGSLDFNYEVLLQRTFANCDIGLQTQFKNVFRFPNNAVLFVPNNGSPYFKCVTDKLYQKSTVSDWLINFDKTYELLLKTTKAMAYGAQNGAVTKAQLTGGHDSRLALAFALATNTQDNFEFESWGVSTADENDISDIKSVKLIEKEFPYLKISYRNICDVLGIDETNAQADIINLIKLTAGASYGPNLAFRSTNNLINETVKYELNGRFGEASRGYWSLKNDSVVGINSTVNILDNNKHNLKLLNKHYQSSYLSYVQKAFNNIPSIYDFDFMYALCWMPQNHAGLIYRNSISLLCNALLHHCGFTTFTEYRVQNALFFKLMHKANSKLTKIPFSGTRWNPLVYLNLPDAAEYAQIPRIEESKFQVISEKVTLLRLKAIYENLFDVDKDFFEYLDEKEYMGLIRDKDSLFGEKADLSKAYNVFTLGSLLITPNICKNITFIENCNLSYKELLRENLYCFEKCPYNDDHFGNTVFTLKETKENNYYVLISKDAYYSKLSDAYNNNYRFINIYFNRTSSLDVKLKI